MWLLGILGKPFNHCILATHGKAPINDQARNVPVHRPVAGPVLRCRRQNASKRATRAALGRSESPGRVAEEKVWSVEIPNQLGKALCRELGVYHGDSLEEGKH